MSKRKNKGVSMKGLEGRIEELEQHRPRKILGPIVVRLMPGDPDYVRPKGQEDEPGPIIIDCRNVIPKREEVGEDGETKEQESKEG